MPTQADLDILDAAILAHASGKLVEVLTFSDQTFNFAAATLAERMAFRVSLAQAIAAAAGTSRYRLAATSKGV